MNKPDNNLHTRPDDGHGVDSSKKLFPKCLEVQAGDTLYKVTSIYSDKGDFHTLWEELIIKTLQAKTEQDAV